MDEQLFFSMFEGLPRQGPGSDECTAKAFSMVSGIPRDARVLDIGCGSGMQTLALARLCPGCRITAVDIHQPFLNDLTTRAEEAGFGGRITTVRASMDDLSFDSGSFDLIWAEGSAYIMGFDNALRSWKRFLRPGGHVVVSECVWFTDTPAARCKEYFAEIYPAMRTEHEVEAAIRSAGYTFQNSFRLPAPGWWAQYYIPLERRLELFEREYGGNEEAMALVRSTREEMEVHRRYSREYGYAYFIMRA
ncbi:MAG: class I SAM-dependent methyltransferase [Methanoregulaceae archaeon]|nr:class I SAM-dependent methyltransferase [Methanoregulaceae archaeon]